MPVSSASHLKTAVITFITLVSVGLIGGSTLTAEGAQTVVGGEGQAAASPDSSSSCVPMSELTSMVFQQGMTQTRRRSSNVPTLQCVGNCPSDAPALLQALCTRQGTDDYGKPTWRCVPQFAYSGGSGAAADSTNSGRRYGLGMVRVECEGCTKSGDPNVLKGSCSLKYSITSAGRGKRERRQRQRRRGYNEEDDISSTHSGSFLDGFFMLFFAVSSCFVLGALFRRCWGDRSREGPYYSTAAYSDQPHEGGVVMGKPVHVQQHHYHHNTGGGGSGFGGFGTGMLAGYVLGDVMSRTMHHHPHGYGYGGGGGGYYEGGAWDGGNDHEDGGFDTGGFGGTDSI